MSSLGRQLQQLQIPANLQSSAAFKTHKKASFLFDAKDAADIDNETLFSVGINGLEELTGIEPAFSTFESLFGEASKSLERTLQSKELNEKLDKHIAKFLQYLSPYFLLKPAHKVLEWLIRRFQIHLFNVDSLVTCILPYHETNLFARLVQLLSVKDPSSKWHWLRPIQKAGKPLSKTAFLQHCISDASLLSLVCNMVTEGIQLEIPPSSSRVLFTFYTATVVGVLDMMPAVTEKFLTHLLPHLLQGLKSNISELEASSYMIIAQLCFKCKMEESLVSCFMESIFKNLKPQLGVEGLSCIIYICQSQGIQKLSKRSLKALLKLSELVKLFHQLSSTHVITPLLDVVVPQLVTIGIKNALTDERHNFLDIAQAIVKEIEFEKSSVITLGRVLIEEYCSLREALCDNKIEICRLNEKVKDLMQTLEKKYPTQLESAIEQHLEYIKATDCTNEGGTNQKASMWTMELVSLVLAGMKSQVVPDSSTTLVLSLHHPQAHVRQMAVNRLGDLLRGKEGLSEDSEFVTESLLSRLQDDDPAIVSCVLKLGQVLANNLPASQLVEELLKLLKKKSLEWDEVRNEALLLLVGEWINSADSSLVDRIVFGLLPLLLLYQQSKTVAIPLSMTISGSVLATRHALLSGMKDFVNRKEWKSCEDSNDPYKLALANYLLFHWLGENLMKLEDQQVVTMVQNMTNYTKSLEDESTFHVFLKCVLGEALCMATSKCKMQLCQTITEYVLPDLWEVTRMQGNYQPLKIELAVEQVEQSGNVPLPLLGGLAKLLGKHSTKRLNHVKGAITLWLCGILLKIIPAGSNAVCGQWWISKYDSCEEDVYTKLLGLLLEVVTYGSCTSTSHQEQFKELLKGLFESHFADKLVLLKFLGHLWCKPPQREDESVSALLQVQCLHIANTCLTSASGKMVKELCKSTSTVVPSLLVPVVSPVSSVRKSVLACIKSLKTRMLSSQAGPITALLSELVDNAEELTADPRQLPRVLGEYFAPLISHGKPQSKPFGELKSVKNTLNYMLQPIISRETPSYIRRVILSSLRKVVTQDMMLKLLPVLVQLLDKCEGVSSVLSEDESVLLQLIVQKYTFETAYLLQAESSCWQTLQRLLLHRTSICPGHMSPMMTALGQITNRFFQAIPTEELQLELFKILVDSLLQTRNVEIGNAVKSTILKLCLKADMVSEELLKFDTKNESKPKKRKVKRTQQEHKDEDDQLSHGLQRMTVILELLQYKFNVEEPQRLLQTLFTTLTRCVDLDHSQGASEYIMQLVFSLINNICHRLSLNSSSALAGIVPEDQFDVELIVQCIRSSESPQTHNQALLLLATAAELFPEKVLHNVMSIFTFMGASVLRQDDSYSFEVISKTLDTVIPALIQAGEKQQLPHLTRKGVASLNDIVAVLIRVFVDASPHIPEHRQLSLFTHLISTVGSVQFLHTAVLLLLEKHVSHGSTNPGADKQGGVKSSLGIEFCLKLCHSFGPNVQVEAMLKVLQYIDDLPLEKPEALRKPKMSQKTATSFLSVTPLFDVSAHSAKDLRQFKYTSLSIISSLLNSGDFVCKVHDEGERLYSVFLRLLENTLNFMAKTAQHSEEAPHDASRKFWKALLHKVYEIVDKVNLLLPTSILYDMIKKLLNSSSGTVRRKAMEVLNSKLSYHAGSFPDDQIESLLSLVTVLLAISRAAKDSTETVINKQTALYSLKLLSRLLAKEQPSQFKRVMCTAIEVFSCKDNNVQVVSSALLCVAEVVSGLKAHAIPFLPQLIPSVIKVMKKNENDRNSLLALCSVTALYKTTEALPHFLSPYLVDVLIQVIQLSLAGGSDKEIPEGYAEVTKHSSVDAQLQENLVSLRKALARNVAPRVFISAVAECYQRVVTQQKEYVATLMIVLTDCVSTMKKDDIKTYHSNLFSLFLEALDFRVLYNEEEHDKIVDKTESRVIEAFLSLVIKLSEASFRPMFLRLIDWATRPVSPKERLLVFYRLSDSVAGKLKGLFVLFAGYMVKNCASLLDAANLSKTEETVLFEMSDNRGVRPTCLLLNYVLDCLHKCLMYDTHGFLDSDRFQCLMQPLVDQIENPLGGEAEFKERLSRHLAPCLAQFAVAAGNDAQWKPLNYQVLLKTRHSSAIVRFAALKVLEGFHARLGEDLMVLLPETIPFLSELMEDECFEVEQQCQHVISEIERVLGEPLQKYF